MPVWQGQGYNSGIRDAANLGWKLAAVVNGHAGDELLDTYDVERRKHARAMIDLSTLVGRVISPTNRRVAGLRDRAHPIGARLCPRSSGMSLRCGSNRCRATSRARSCTPQPRNADLAGGHAVHPAHGRHPGAAERLAGRRAGCRLRGAVLEQQPARDSGRRSVRAVEGTGRHFHCGAAADPAALDRPRRPRRGRSSATAPAS